MLSLLILIPVLAALGVLLGAPARKTSLAAAAAGFCLSLFALLNYDRAHGGFQFVSSRPVVSDWNFNYLLAADGLSMVMLLLTGLVTLAAVWLTPPIERRENLFYACVLLIAAGCTGAFATQDLIFFYAFHELALIPTFLLIALWGNGERQSAAWKVTIYLALGSFVLLIGLVDLYFAIPSEHRTFDMRQLAAARDLIPPAAQARPYLLLLVGFGTLISLFPFHSWAPTAYASAPLRRQCSMQGC